MPSQAGSVELVQTSALIVNFKQTQTSTGAKIVAIRFFYLRCYITRFIIWVQTLGRPRFLTIGGEPAPLNTELPCFRYLLKSTFGTVFAPSSALKNGLS